MTKLYCLDTNILIEAWNKHYSMALCPDYWEILDGLAHDKKIFCTMEVKREIEKIDDGLYKWVRERPYFFRELTGKVFTNLQKINSNPANHRLVDSSKFRSIADPWVIAHAMAENAVVVTREGFEANSAKRTKIPNVCQALGVPWIDEFQFINEVGIRFNARIDS